jgi:ribonuclease HI
MILLSWNCRGLGNPRAVRDLCQMAKEKRPEVVFLMETRCRNTKIERIRVDEGYIKERLDRVVANKEWVGLFEEVSVQVLAERSSDHKPLLIRVMKEREERIPVQTGFKFEASWLLDEDYNTIIKESWEGGDTGPTAMHTARQKLALCQTNLKWWSTRKFGNAEKLLKKKTKELELLQQNEGPGTVEAIKKLKDEIEYILEQEDVRWKQRGKQNWYKNGYRNTPFFHAWATHRRKINSIKRIEDEEGRVWKKTKEISVAFTSFYQNLFSAGEVEGVEQCLEGLEARVSGEMNTNLLREFVAEEVDYALKQMHPLKSPGPDGFSACFYQRSWSTVRMEVCKAVLDFLNHDRFDNSINSTNIVLIPKKKSPSQITDYRPISLCNVIYKLIAKVLANRMKQVLVQIISPTQSAFLPGRLITDNVLVAFEALHTMDARMKGRQGFMALKLDMSKVYDRVEWEFLEAIMLKLGFAERWVQLLMTCVRTVTYSILINGQPYGNIQPTRGIRQGDPLSPYFFILCAEGLSHLLHKAERENKISGLPVVRGGIRINHLFFADDSLLFCNANMFEWIQIQELLRVYEQTSGQKLNWDKTSIFFSRNTKQEVRDHISTIAGINSTNSYDKYLGLPLLIGRSRVSTFSGLQGKIWERINGWKEKFLSQASKEVLLKAVIQAIPTYTMSVFLLPKTICHDIVSMISRFWWGHKENDGRVAWMSWKKMGLTKEKGGLGFRDLEFFNLALLAKQGWRLLQNPNSLVATIMKAKYYPNSSFLEANIGRKPSYAWRSIWNSKTLLKEGLIWRVGDGRTIRIWDDPWLPRPRAHPAQSPVTRIGRDAKVCELLDETTNWWNMDLEKEIFNEDEANMICGIGVSPRGGTDFMAWEKSKNGMFTVRSAYHLALERFGTEEGSCSNTHVTQDLWKKVWSLKGSRVVKFFLWKACNDVLPTKEKLFKRKITPDPLCPICGSEPESTSHILWNCPAAQDVWSECNGKLQKRKCGGDDFMELLESLRQCLNEEEMHLMVTVARQIWLRRNKMVFEGEFQSPSALVRLARDQVEAFDNATRRLSDPQERDSATVENAWEKPPNGVVKINWDGAVDSPNGKVGMGAIARDQNGNVIAMVCGGRQYVTDPVMAEALALCEAVELSNRVAAQKLILEGDAATVIHAVNQVELCRGEYGQLINGAKQLLNQGCQWQVRHVRRVANGAAHQLAKMGLQSQERHFWVNNFSLCMRDIVLADAR